MNHPKSCAIKRQKPIWIEKPADVLYKSNQYSVNSSPYTVQLTIGQKMKLDGSEKLVRKNQNWPRLCLF